eukprot:5463055-Amphidinium_carterae.1
MDALRQNMHHTSFSNVVFCVLPTYIVDEGQRTHKSKEQAVQNASDCCILALTSRQSKVHPHFHNLTKASGQIPKTWPVVQLESQRMDVSRCAMLGCIAFGERPPMHTLLALLL